MKFLRIYSPIFRELKESFPLGLEFFKRDFLVRYRQSFLGLAWALLVPILTSGIFLMLLKHGVLNAAGIGVPYIVYAFFGISAWQLFQSGLMTVANTAPAGKQLMVTVKLPPFSYFYSPSLTLLTDFGIRMLFLAFLLAATRTSVNAAMVPAALLAMLPLILLGTGLGLAATIINSITRDLSNVLQMGLQFLMFLSPVLYPVAGRGGALGTFAQMNPITYLIDVPRALLFGTDLPVPFAGYAVTVFLCFLVFLACLRFYYLSLSRVLEIA